ncbi:MAG TPA: histidine kinase [Solirubrobacteraceae bacterium]
MTRTRTLAVALAALVCGVVVAVVALNSDHQEAKVVWAIFGPVLGWNFIGTGLYAWRRRPESRIGALMVLLGFAWFLSVLSLTNSPVLYSIAQISGGLWGGVFLQLEMTFPSGRLASAADRAIVVAGYLVFTVVSIPALLVADQHDLGCDECPDNVLLVHHNHTLATIALGFQAVLYVALFVIVLVRLALRWWRTSPLERLQLTPVYTCGLLAFLLVTVATAGGGDVAWWAAFVATAILPFAFMAGLLRSHVARLDAELRARLQDLRASRTRLVQAGDTERRRLERDLHDGAQARLVGVALLLAHARRRLAGDSDLAATLDRATDELKTSLAELRELARGIHPAVLTDQGLERAVAALAARVPVPVTLDAEGGERLPAAVEIAAYYVVSEALQNVAKYAQATQAGVAIRRVDGRVIVDVTDDGIGGADAGQGSGLAGLADRLGALDGTLAVDSPPGRGTRLHAEIPYGLVDQPSSTESAPATRT